MKLILLVIKIFVNWVPNLFHLFVKQSHSLIRRVTCISFKCCTSSKLYSVGVCSVYLHINFELKLFSVNVFRSGFFSVQEYGSGCSCLDDTNYCLTDVRSCHSCRVGDGRASWLQQFSLNPFLVMAKAIYVARVRYEFLRAICLDLIVKM